jgi:hypothetical protein
MTFEELYGDRLDDELGTADRTELFTLVKRKLYLNEGQRVFNEHTGCYVKRVSLSVVDGTQEYDVEAAATDVIRPSGTTASLKMVGASTTSYREGRELPLVTEETLNNVWPNWRAASAGVPECLYWRTDAGSRFLGFSPAPDIPVGETWTLLLPSVAQPPDMSATSDEPFGASAPLIVLRPYHRAVLHYAAAMLERLRKNTEGTAKHLAIFGLNPATLQPTGEGFLGKYQRDQAPKSGQGIRLATNYRSRRFGGRPLDPTRWP